MVRHFRDRWAGMRSVSFSSYAQKYSAFQTLCARLVVFVDGLVQQQHVSCL